MCLGSSRYIKYLVFRRREGREVEGGKKKAAHGTNTVELCLTFFQTKAKSNDVRGKEFLLPFCKNVFYYHFPPPTPPPTPHFRI